MQHTFTKRMVTCLSILLASASMVFAGANSEQLYQKAVQAADNGSVAVAVKAYDDLQAQVAKDYSKAIKKLQTAYDKRDKKAYDEAYSTLAALDSYRLNKDQTDSLLKAILVEDDPQKTTDAQWLYQNSQYYRPVLSLDYSTKGDGYSFSYSQQQVLPPGTELTLPTADDLRFSTSRIGQLMGWGLTPDSLDYQAGETITMPFTSQTLYAQWQDAVTFSDPISNTDISLTDITDGAEVAVPIPTAPDSSYIFAGWREQTSGKTLAPNTETYTVSGKGAAFKGMWKSLALTDLSTAHYDIAAIPVNTQLSASFSMKNQGTEPLRNVTVTLSSDSPYVSVLNPTVTYRGISAGQEGIASGFRFLVKGNAQVGAQIPLTVTATDNDGNTWTQTFTATVK